MFSIETLAITDDWVTDTTQMKEENGGKRPSILSFSNNDSGLQAVIKSEFERQPAILKESENAEKAYSCIQLQFSLQLGQL